jgi:hypothetical protein
MRSGPLEPFLFDGIVARVNGASHAGVGQVTSRLCGCFCGAVVERV